MKILLAGGERTQNIVDGIIPKVKHGGIEFMVVKHIEQVQEIFVRGEYFDRAIIIEQSWSHDFQITDELARRQKINEFAKSVAERQARGVDYVFLTQFEEEAERVYEEILPIRNESIVVVKKPRYSVNFFVGLITNDLGQFPSDIVYKPKVVEEVQEDIEDIQDLEDEADYTTEEVEDWTEDLFGEDLEWGEMVDEYPEETEDSIEEIEVVDEEIVIEPKESIEIPKVEKLGGMKFNRGKARKSRTQILDTDYEDEPEETRQVSELIDRGSIRQTLNAFASRGNSIVVTGCGGCGTSTVAYNIANTLNNIGYTVLLVDMDTKGKTQSYISRDNYDSMEVDGANLLSALRSSSGINANVAIAREGFRLLTMGMGGETVKLEDMVERQKLYRFVNLAKTDYNFVVYDIPFEDAVGCVSDVTFMADNIVIVVDSSNWGITKTMLTICNIDSEDMMDIIFGSGQLVFNRHKELKRLMNKRVRRVTDIPKIMDNKVQELVGLDPGFYFQEMHIAGILEEDEDYEASWFKRTQYSDTDKGFQVYSQLIQNILLKQ